MCRQERNPMAGDSEKVSQDEIEDLLRQAQQVAGHTPPPIAPGVVIACLVPPVIWTVADNKEALPLHLPGLVTDRIALFIVAFVVWMALSNLWSPNPRVGIAPASWSFAVLAIVYAVTSLAPPVAAAAPWLAIHNSSPAHLPEADQLAGHALDFGQHRRVGRPTGHRGNVQMAMRIHHPQRLRGHRAEDGHHVLSRHNTFK